MKYLLTILVILVTFIVAVASARAQFSCSGFTESGACGVASGQPFKIVGNTTPMLEGSQLLLFPTGSNHAVATLIYQTKVNVQSFNSTFSFVPNGLFFSFIFNNTTNVPGYQGSSFQGGAGCEADFFQGYGIAAPPNNVFALDFDSYDPLNAFQTAPYDFVHSSVQAYQSNLPVADYPNMYVQCPCIGGSDICGTNTSPSDGSHQVTKLSTAPVSLNSPVSTAETTTGDTYHASLAYSGNILTLDMFDQTTNGSHYTHKWTGINIPNSVGGSSAWVGLGASSSGASRYPLYVKSFTYSAGAAPVPTPAPTSTPPPPTSNSCEFINQTGVAMTWTCSQGAGLFNDQQGGPIGLDRPPVTGTCQFISKAGTTTWQCQ